MSSITIATVYTFCNPGTLSLLSVPIKANVMRIAPLAVTIQIKDGRQFERL